MKKSIILTIMISFMTITSLFPFQIYAAEQDNDIVTLNTIRAISEKDELKNIYMELYPNEYHFIEQYETNGINQNILQDDIELVFSDSKELNGITYDLIVMNNGQIFTNYSENISVTKAGKTTASFTVGDLGHYNTFNITYTINSSGYDKINKCNTVTGSGFYLYPLNLSKKLSEDSDGPAYYGYNNVSMNYDGSGILYDIGVAVGNNKAKGVTAISTGADMWLWAFIYAFFF